jgi:RNA 3'-terminal phosphate cyclase (ATP)
LIQIDGSLGEGGGQIVRSSLALSLVTRQPVTINRVRAGRERPGLKRQHVTAVQAARKISNAQVDGVEVGSSRLVFKPGPVQSGDYTFRITTAGSTTLVLQTILPALMLADAPSTVTLEGGTHNTFAPPYDFLARVYLPLLERMGPQVATRIERYGFFPAGGGRFTVNIQPASQLNPFQLLDRGKVVSQAVKALLAQLPRHIGQRECATAVQRLGWPASSARIEEVKNSPGPGNAVIVELQSQHVTELFTGFGQRGVRAEKVARQAADQAASYLAGNVPVGEYLADQLLLPLGLGAHQGTGGGVFRTLPLSLHSTTHIDLLRRFLDIDMTTQEQPDGSVIVKAATG